MDDLIEWLKVQLGEDERLARECIAQVGSHRAGDMYDDQSGVADFDAFPSYPWGACRDQELTFMAGPGHPDAVLADCEAKRELVDEHGPLRDRPDDRTYCGACRNGGSYYRNGPELKHYPCLTLRLLAEPYAKLGRPGYRSEWAP